MSCLITNSCSCLIQSLAATVDSMTLLKFLVSDCERDGLCLRVLLSIASVMGSV